MDWISTKDKLPEINKMVLGWMAEFEGEIVLAKFKKNGEWDFQGLDYGYLCHTKEDISHWCQLPLDPELK